MMRTLLAGLTAVALFGCDGPPDLMPLEPGRSWTYTVFTGFEKYVEPMKLVRSVAVGDAQGFELKGTFGSARLAWSGTRLVADRLGSARFDPPIPLLVLDAKGPIAWRGSLDKLSGHGTASATLTQENETVNVGSQPYKSTKSTLSIQSGSTKIELTTWFAPGYGIVRQEQRTNGRQNLSIELLSGPS